MVSARYPAVAEAASAPGISIRSRIPFRGLAALLVAIVAPLPAQAGTAGADPAVPVTQQPTAQQPTAQQPTAQQPATPAPVFARALADGVKLRCWPGNAAEPPVFEDTLAKDQVVQVGRSENGFRAVILPLGPVGYVSGKFTAEAADGRVTSKGTKVAFRYRPRTSEAPVTQLADGTELSVVGEQDDWLRVRVAGVEAWVLESEVKVADATDAGAAAAYETWRKQQAGEVQARLDGIAKKKQQEQQDQADLAAVQVVEAAFATELKKPMEDQQYTAINEALGKLEATLAEASSGRAAIASLKKRIETQKWLVDAAVLLVSKPPLPDAPPPEKKDELERFVGIGWLRYESRLNGPGVYYLEKGGQHLHVITCNTGRYDLSLFIDREIGVTGPRRRPATESLSVLDVERLEVLGTAKH